MYASRPRLRILLVDDHRVFAEVLGMRLRAEPEVAETLVAVSLADARAALPALEPHLVLLDAQLGDVSGLALLQDIAALERGPRVLVLSGSCEPSSLVRALRAGAGGWVTKGVSYEELLSASRQVLEGEMSLPQAALRPVIQQLLADAPREPAEHSFLDEITDRQLEVLRCLVSGMTRREIAARLFVTVNTINSHVQHMLHHAGQHSTPALVAAARSLGVLGVDEWQPSAGTRRPLAAVQGRVRTNRA